MISQPAMLDFPRPEIHVHVTAGNAALQGEPWLCIIQSSRRHGPWLSLGYPRVTSGDPLELQKPTSRFCEDGILTEFTAAVYVGNEGMIQSRIINDHPSNAHSHSLRSEPVRISHWIASLNRSCYPLINQQFTIENGHLEIVDLSNKIQKGWFSIVMSTFTRGYQLLGGPGSWTRARQLLVWLRSVKCALADAIRRGKGGTWTFPRLMMVDNGWHNKIFIYIYICI